VSEKSRSNYSIPFCIKQVAAVPCLALKCDKCIKFSEYKCKTREVAK